MQTGEMVRSATQFATQIRVIEKAFHPFRRPFRKLEYPEAATARAEGPVSSQPINNYIINDAIVNFRFRIAHHGKYTIRESLYGIPDEEIANTIPTAPLSTPEIGSRIGVYGFIWAAPNFYHWMTQVLTSIESTLAYRDKKDVVLITDKNLSHWQERSLELLNYGLDRFTLEPHRFYMIQSLEISDFCVMPTVMSRTALQVFKRLKHAVGLETTKGRRIYASRQDVTFRRVANEDELIELLRKFNFEILVLGNLDLNEQIRWFHDAAIVVGPHGQGMCHVAFCTEGTLVWELFPEHFITESTIGIAATCGLRYHSDTCPQTLTAERSQVTDFNVNLDLVRQRLIDWGL